jgi:predicted O-linked N-acetylglucosamine transferase (SPINDLY family)
MPEFAADDDDRFVAIAAELADNFQRRAELRKTLRDRIARSPLMNAPRFAANVEAAYRQMWKDLV